MKFTAEVRSETDTWAKALYASNMWIFQSTQQEILKFLNEREYLCTPGFLIRRQIQILFPDFIAAAQKLLPAPTDIANLEETKNVPWDAGFVAALARVLSTKILNLDSEQWEDYLADKRICQRQTAVRLIFALNMNDEIAAKFLISNGHSLFSVRNPFDFICKFCLSCKPRLSYAEASAMLNEFETRLADISPQENPSKPKIGMTTKMISEMESIAKNDKISETDKRQRFISYMLRHEGEFVRKVNGVYPSGFSLQNISRLRILMKYLAIVYPGDIVLGRDDEEVAVPVKRDGAGVPKNYEELTRAMYYPQNIELKDYMELGLPAAGAELNAFYSSVPFNREVLIRLKRLSDTLRAIMRAEKNPTNAQDIQRSTIMILAYFFITGYLYTKKELADTLTAEIANDLAKADDEEERKLLEGLEHVMTNLENIADSQEPIKIYIESLNWLLKSFSFSEFYPPFVLDRFMLICLLADPLNAPLRDVHEKSLHFLIQLVIDENYRLN